MDQQKAQKKRFTTTLFVGLFLALSIVGAVFRYNGAVASPLTCDDPKEGWYKCYQQLSSVTKYVNNWCVNADNKYREVCQVTLISDKNIDYSPPGIKVQDPGCTNPGKAFKMQSKCWVIINPSGEWYGDLVKYSQNCSFVTPDPNCTEVQTFLTKHNWQVDQTAQTGLGSQSIDQTSPEKTAFLIRITAYLRWLIIGIGVLAVFSMVIAGIQYAAAQDNPQAIAAAKGRITNVVIGILIYFTMFAALQWLIPGGLF